VASRLEEGPLAVRVHELQNLTDGFSSRHVFDNDVALEEAVLVVDAVHEETQIDAAIAHDSIGRNDIRLSDLFAILQLRPLRSGGTRRGSVGGLTGLHERREGC
jgi:hypothetical protein